MKNTKISPAFGLFLAGALLTGAGCGNSTTPSSVTTDQKNTPPKQATARACDLFTKEHAKALLGPTVGEGNSTVTEPNQFGSTVTSCSYTTESTDIKQIKTATLLIRYAKDEEESKQAFTGAKEQAPSLAGNAQPETIAGYGDEAYWIGGKLNQLNVRKGTGWYILSTYQRDGDQKTTIMSMADLVFKK